MTQGPPTLNADGDVSTGHCRGLAVTWSLRLAAPGKGRFPDGSIQGQPKTLITTPTSKQRTPDCLSCTLVFTPDRDDGSRPCCQPVWPAGSPYLQGVEHSKHVLEDQGPVTDSEHPKHP